MESTTDAQRAAWLQWRQDEEMEKIVQQKKVNGGAWQVEALQKVPELIAQNRMSQSQKIQGSEGKKNLRGWSMEEMKDKPSSSLVEDTEEMIGWRAMSQVDVDECWKKIAGKMKEDILNKYKVEDTKDRGAPLEWTLVRRSKKYRIRKWCEDCWTRFFSWLREYD